MKEARWYFASRAKDQPSASVCVEGPFNTYDEVKAAYKIAKAHGLFVIMPFLSEKSEAQQNAEKYMVMDHDPTN